ncbi:MAG: hypothetical protein EBS06_06085 [Proteobacteria bacterium]|nr:hypothetical protein [Pseudomonadota bacterium]
MKYKQRFFAIAMVLCAASHSARADEPVFGYIYTTDLNPKGTTQFEQKIDDRYGQAHGSYNNVKMQSEIEHGVTDSFQAALYINYSFINAKKNSVAGTTEGIDIPANHNPDNSFHASRYDSFSIELIKRVLSPYTDPIGLAFYFEPTLGPRERELEGKVILHKNFLDDQLITAANITISYEQEKTSSMFGTQPGDDDYQDPHWEKAAMLDFSAGVSYRFIPNWFFGVEYRNHNEFGGTWRMSRATQEHTAHFLGPVLHYGGRKFFATLGFRYQIGANAFGEQKAETYHGKVYGDEHTRVDGIRLILGYPF